MKEPNKIHAISEDRIGPVPQSERKHLKKRRARSLRRYAKQDLENISPKAKHSGWYW